MLKINLIILSSEFVYFHDFSRVCNVTQNYTNLLFLSCLLMLSNCWNVILNRIKLSWSYIYLFLFTSSNKYKKSQVLHIDGRSGDFYYFSCMDLLIVFSYYYINLLFHITSSYLYSFGRNPLVHTPISILTYQKYDDT